MCKNVFAKERQEIQTGYRDLKDGGYDLRGYAGYRCTGCVKDGGYGLRIMWDAGYESPWVISNI